MTRETGSKSKGLHIVVPSFDGHIYVIEGMLKCAERIDIGEHIYRYYMRRVVLIVLYSAVLCCVLLYCVVLCYTASYCNVFCNFRFEIFSGSGVWIRQSENVCVCVCVISFYFSIIGSLFLYLKLISNYLISLLRNLFFAVLQ